MKEIIDYTTSIVVILFVVFFIIKGILFTQLDHVGNSIAFFFFTKAEIHNTHHRSLKAIKKKQNKLSYIMLWLLVCLLGCLFFKFLIFQ